MLHYFSLFLTIKWNGKQDTKWKLNLLAKKSVYRICIQLRSIIARGLLTPLIAPLVESSELGKIVALWSKVPNIAFGRTIVKSTNWLHHSRKYRIEIFGRSVTKMGQKSWRDTLSTTGAMFRGKLLAPGQNFWILRIWSHHSRKYQILIFGYWATKTGQKSWRDTLRTTGAKYSLQVKHFQILHVWLHQGRKYPIGIFNCSATKTSQKAWRDTQCATGPKFLREILR